MLLHMSELVCRRSYCNMLHIYIYLKLCAMSMVLARKRAEDTVALGSAQHTANEPLGITFRGFATFLHRGARRAPWQPLLPLAYRVVPIAWWMSHSVSQSN